MENDIFINTLQLDDQIEGVYFLKNAGIKKTSKGQAYLWATISDSSGAISAVKWSYNGSIGNEDKTGYVYIKGTVTSFKDKLQITLDRICPAAKPDDQEENADAPKKEKKQLYQHWVYVIACDSKFCEGEKIYIRSSHTPPYHTGVADINNARWFKALDTARKEAAYIKYGNPRIEQHKIYISEEALEIFEV